MCLGVNIQDMIRNMIFKINMASILDQNHGKAGIDQDDDVDDQKEDWEDDQVHIHNIQQLKDQEGVT